jgi:hypothetical protein
MLDNDESKGKFSRFLSDAAGIIQSPGHTLGRLMEQKKWVPVFLLLVITIGIFTYLIYPIQVKHLAEQARMSGYLSEDEAAYLFNTSTLSRLMAVVFSAITVTLTLIFAAFFVYLFYGIGGAEGMYANYFSVVTNASIIDMLFPALLRTLSLLSGIGFSVFSKPALLLFSLPPRSLSFLILARLDIFDLWYLAAIAAGIGVFSKMSIKKSLFIAFFYFLFKTFIGVAFSYLGMQFMPRA